MSRTRAIAQIAAMASMAITPAFPPCRVTRAHGPTSVITVRAPRLTHEEARTAHDGIVRALEALGSGITRDPRVERRGRDHVATVDYDINPRLIDEALERTRATRRLESVDNATATGLAHGWSVYAYGADERHPDTVEMLLHRASNEVVDIEFRAHRDTGFFRFHKASARTVYGSDSIRAWCRLREKLVGPDAPDTPTLDQLREIGTFTAEKHPSGATWYEPTRRLLNVDARADNAALCASDGVSVLRSALCVGDVIVGYPGTVTHTRVQRGSTDAPFRPDRVTVFFEDEDERTTSYAIDLPRRFVVARAV